MKTLLLFAFVYVFISCNSQQSSIVNVIGNEEERIEKTADIYTSDLIVLLSCADSSLLGSYHFTTPDSCRRIFEESTEVDHNRRNTRYRNCIYECLSSPRNGYKCDTIYLSSPDILVWIPSITTWEDQFIRLKNDTYNKDGSLYGRIEYYKVEELANVCVTRYFRMKSKEFWKDGKRDSICEYYHKTGELKELVEYKSGKVIRREKY